jgi:hypothetical protein
MKTKPVLLILATLVIGFVLGMLTSAQIRYHKLNPVRVFFSEDRFREGFYRTIQPDEQQKAKIDVVLNKYARINSDLQSTFRKEFESSMNEFRKEIDTYLTKDQIERLKEMDRNRQKMSHRGRPGHYDDSIDYDGDRRHFHEGRSSHGKDRQYPPGDEADPADSVNNK